MCQQSEARQGKVQDRLYDHHKKQMAMQKNLEQKQIKEAKENAKPQISSKSKSYA